MNENPAPYGPVELGGLQQLGTELERSRPYPWKRVVLQVQVGLHGIRLGMGKPLHQLLRIGILNQRFIESAHLYTVGNRRLLEQAAAGR